ncbi:hypothetical protein P3T37_000331 [Kitasatospora sp. MAA4]|uniref:NACHT domain-containing protein n=1 Tax=Kitasatospora sp. MAA4 TaxID=3035093 RepID=UPI00247615E4|nr:serine protease [Kitasatospora sp. MAA4]MDH6130964.1 hypothetical protein [Kitasatospora sp. MAA4]
MPQADEGLWAAFVTLLAEDGRVVGGGVLTHIADDTIAVLTCAHVVNLALPGRDVFEQSHPGEATVRLAFPAAPGTQSSATVEHWWPARSLTDVNFAPVRGKDRRWSGDLAVLKIAGPLLSELRPVPLVAPTLTQRAWTWFGSGEPSTVVRLQVNGIADEWVVLETPPTGHAVQGGYSGSPLWDRDRSAVVGLMVSAHDPMPVAQTRTDTPVRQCYAIRGDEIIRRVLDNGDDRWARLDPQVQTLLTAQAQAARAFPYRAIGVHRDDLTLVYIRQQLSDDSADGPAAARQKVDIKSLPSPPDNGHRSPRTVEESLAYHRHLMVLGAAGTGKSTLTLQLSTQLVAVPKTGESDGRPLIPVRVLARDLASRSRVDLLEAIADAAAESVAVQVRAGLSPDLFSRSASGLRWLVIVDGLDEVEDTAARADLSARLRRFMSTASDHRLLITSRSLPEREAESWGTVNSLARYEIEPFQRDQRKDFAEKWFAGQSELTQRFLKEVASGHLEDVVSVPLLATVAAIVFESQPERPLPQSRFALYEQFLGYLYDSRAAQLVVDLRKRLSGWPGADHIVQHLVDQRASLLEHLASAALRGEPLLPTALQWLRSSGGEPHPQPPDWMALVASVLTSTGLLVHDGATLRFIHHSFAEHLAASAEAHLLPARFDPADPVWWSVLWGALAGGRERTTLLHRALRGQATELLDWLLAGNDRARELAAAMIFEGVPSLPQQREVLAETVDYWLWRTITDAGYMSQAVRVINGVQIAPGEVVDILRTVVEDYSFPAPVRDSCSRALLRTGGENVLFGMHGLAQIVDSREVTRALRLRAAESLVDLGGLAHSIIRPCLANLMADLRGVSTGYSEAVQDLMQEIEEATQEGQELDVPDLLRPTVTKGSNRAARSGVWKSIYYWRARENPDWSASVGFSGEPAAYVGVKDEVLADEARMGLEDGTRHGHKDGIPEDLISGFGLSCGDLLNPPAIARVVLETLVEISRAAARESLDAHWKSVEGLFCDGDVGELDNSFKESAGARHRLDVFLYDPLWGSAAKWLISRADLHTEETINDAMQLVEGANRLSPVQRDALAAFLVYGPPQSVAAAVQVFSDSIVAEPTRQLRLELFGDACVVIREGVAGDALVPAASLVSHFLAAPMIDSELMQMYLRVAKVIGSEVMAEQLVLNDSRGPEFFVAVLRELDPSLSGKAAKYLADQIEAGFPFGVGAWCRAVRSLGSWSEESRQASVRLLGKAAIEVELPDAFGIFETLVVLDERSQAGRHLADVAQDISADQRDRRRAVRMLLDIRVGHTDVAFSALVGMIEHASPAERIELATDLARVNQVGHEAAYTAIFDELERSPLEVGDPAYVLAAAADLGPTARSRLARDIRRLRTHWSIPHKAQLRALEKLALLGPDLHRAAQGALEHMALSLDGIERVSSAARIHALGWISPPKSSRLLTRIAKSEERIEVRAFAARKLVTHGAAQRRLGVDFLYEIAISQSAHPLLVLQACREIAEAGEEVMAREPLRALVANAGVMPAHRHEAALLLMMIDLACGPVTASALAFLTADASVDPHIRSWAEYAMSFIGTGIRPIADGGGAQF